MIEALLNDKQFIYILYIYMQNVCDIWYSNKSFGFVEYENKIKKKRLHDWNYNKNIEIIIKNTFKVNLKMLYRINKSNSLFSISNF